MRAAVVDSFRTPPTCQEIAAPVPGGPDEVLVEVIAVGLHPRVRSQADGSHYTSSGELPLVPGIDGVGRTADGVLRYFVLHDTTMGAMAEQTVIDVRRSVVLASGSDPFVLAAAMNPAMSSWVALRRRISFVAGQRVLVLGATGNAGRLALQVAKYLGAAEVIGVGRRVDQLANLADLGADATVALADTGALGRAGAEVDVVIDYVWGQPTADAMAAIVTHRTDDNRPLTWIEVGSVAGSTAAIPSAALRATRLQLVGSGQGSVSTGDILAELPELATAISAGAFTVAPRVVALADVETAWRDVASSQRIVIAP
jgi:NADPH:quinone reductase-like Zn-dependent oxidoreductase